jgi:hypothetical protein
MARYSEAQWDPARYSDGRPRSGVPFVREARAVVHHKTQTDGGTGWSLYGRTGSWPHFTVHFDTEVGARALVNSKGGVETNADGVIQIETVGWSGVDMDPATLGHLVKLLKWIATTHDIPWVWPNGRPRPAADGPRDPGGHNRNPWTWGFRGHFGHSQVPENTHWDPAYTDWEWWWLNAAFESMAVAALTALQRVDPMFNPPVPAVAAIATPSGYGVWLLTSDGGVFTAGDAPYLGGMNGSTHFVGRTAAKLERHGDGYVIVATSGERYVPDSPWAE